MNTSNKRIVLSSSKIALILNIIFLGISLLLFAYIYWRSEINYSGVYNEDRNLVYRNYYIISIIGIIFWSGLLYAKNEIRENSILLICGTMIGIYLIELTLIFIPVKTAHQRLIKEITDKGLEVSVSENVEGFIKKSELAKERADQRTDRFAVDEKIDAKILSVDNKNRIVNLSINLRI